MTERNGKKRRLGRGVKMEMEIKVQTEGAKLENGKVKTGVAKDGAS